MGFDFFIVGAQKAASTSLQRSLASASGIHLLPGEIGLFEEPEWGESTAKQQLAAWRKEAGGRLLGGKRPNLLGEARPLRRLVESSPGVKLVVVLRDPVKRAFSALVHLSRYGSLEMIDPSRELVRWVRSYPNLPDPARTVLSYGRYGEHLARICDTHPSVQMLVITEEALRSRDGWVTERMSAFLGVPIPRLVSSERRNVGAPNRVRIRYFRWITGLCFRRDAVHHRILQREPRPLFSTMHRALAQFDTRVLAKACKKNDFHLTADAAEVLHKFYQEDQASLAYVHSRANVHWC